MQSQIREIAEDTFCLTLRPPGSFISFNHFLIRDSAPALVHTGHNKTFEEVLALVASLIEPSTLKYICFSHYEPDECGSLNQWLKTAPEAQACVNKLCDSNLKDTAIRPSRVLKDGDTLSLGSHEIRLLETPHFPHAWEASLYVDTRTKVLYSSDLGTQPGFPEPNGKADLEEIVEIQNKLQYMPYGPHLVEGVNRLRELDFETMAVMHGQALDRRQSMELLDLLLENNAMAEGTRGQF